MTLILILAGVTWVWWVVKLSWYLIELVVFWEEYWEVIEEWWRLEYGLRKDT